MEGSRKIFGNQVGVDEVEDLEVALAECVELDETHRASEVKSKQVSSMRLKDSELVNRAHATSRKRAELNLTEAVKARLLVGNTIDMIADAIVNEMLTGNSSILKEMFNRIDGPVSEQTVSYQVKMEMSADQQVAKLKELEARARRRMRADAMASVSDVDDEQNT